MDFFSQQDKARRNTLLLVLLFLTAVLTLIGITNLLVVVTIWSLDGSLQGRLNTLLQPSANGLPMHFDVEQFLLIAVLVSSVVSLAIIYKWLQLAGGGKRVAESLGGVRIQPNSDDMDERRVLNVVAEMALASGMPVPPVYLLDQELGINAFAAGNTPADAVIGVTRGCITAFNREQLQGVIAHEFSHILNGDMRLNLRLIAMLHGIVFIGAVGRILIRTRSSSRSSRRSGGGQIALLGLALIVIGWLGGLFGQLIRASVSRQREFLADASAVQFTRNPQGIGDALKIIGGYQYGTEVAAPNTTEVSHLFFGRALGQLNGLFATHPPLMERILRIDPRWDGNYKFPKPSNTEALREHEQQREAERKRKQQLLATVLATATGTALVDEGTVQAADQMLDYIPVEMQQAATDPLSAMALVFALLMPDEQYQAQQLACLQGSSNKPGLEAAIAQNLPLVRQLQPSLRLALLQLCMPALKCLSAEQYRQFKQCLLLLMRVDQQIDLFEWCLYQLVRHYLDAEFGYDKPSKPKYKKPQQVADSYQLLLSLLAHHGHDNAEEAQRAFVRGAGTAGLYNLQLLPESDCSLDKMAKAMAELACAYPILKPRLLRGFANAVQQDKQVTPVEKDLLTTIAVLMDSPLPTLKLLQSEP